MQEIGEWHRLKIVNKADAEHTEVAEDSMQRSVYVRSFFKASTFSAVVAGLE